MRTTIEARKSWQTLQRYTSLDDLRTAVTKSDGQELESHGIRSACWKTFFLFEDVEFDTWPSRLEDSRSAYTSLRLHYLRGIENPDEAEAFSDPLSDETESPWHALRRDEEARREIFQDVDRCMPDNLYFRQPETQAILLDVLFIWSKLNPDVGYRQGMHEVLALILWVVEREAIEENPSARVDPGDSVMLAVFNARFIGHDAFTLFCLIMQGLKSSYEPGGTINASLTTSGNMVHEAPIIKRSQRIVRNLLERIDPALANHLEEIAILPQLFVMRWIRLLFSREFSFDETLKMWDVIFAHDTMLDNVDLICVAMLLRVRWKLMECDNNEAIALLLRYPQLAPGEGPMTLVADAIYLDSNLSVESGATLVMQYSHRLLPLVVPPLPLSPPSGRSGGKPFHGALTPLSNPAKLLHQSGGLEALLQDAAKGVYTRGEKWGVNKALRDAVGEIRKNVHNLQSPTRPSETLHAERLTDHSLNRRQLSARSSTDDPLRKIDDLQARNKLLASMLEVAVADLWSQQKMTVEEAPTDDDTAKAFTVAIGKVQFVQIYLEDSSLPLIIEQAPENTPAAPVVNLAVNEPEIDPQIPLDTSMVKNEEEPAGVNPLGLASEAAVKVMPYRNSTQMSSTPAASSASRPGLAQSSFSWMLDTGTREPQRKEARTPTRSRQSARSTFASGSPFTSASPSNTGSVRKQDLDFLFGDPLAVGEDSASPGKDSVSRKVKDENRSKKKTEETSEGEVYRLNTMRGKGNFSSTA